MKIKKESESFDRKSFEKLSVEDVFKVVRAAHVLNVRYKYGRVVQTESAADSLMRAFTDLDEAFAGTSDKHIPVRRN